MAQPPNTGASTGRAARRWSVACCLALLSALAVGCTSADSATPAPPTTVREPRPLRAPTVLPDTRQVSLGAVAGTRAVYPVGVHGGDLVMGGLVVGPDGPVAGATVRLERFVGERSGRLEVRTNDAGRWVAIDVHGGRYRFRAWHAPDLAMTASDVRFVAADAEVDLTLTVDRFTGSDVTGDVDDEDPELGSTVVVSALATRQQVDGDGIITTAPASGRDARLTPIGPWSLEGPANAVVDDAGRVSWPLTCDATGSVSARIEVLGVATVVSATCVEPVLLPPPVEVPEPDFDIGESFRPPFAGPLPAGTYTVVDHPGTCALTYESWNGTSWDPARRTVTGIVDIELPTIARNLAMLGDSVPCTYERVS